MSPNDPNADPLASLVAQLHSLPDGPPVIWDAVRLFVRDEREKDPDRRVLIPRHFEKIHRLVRRYGNWAEAYLHEYVFDEEPAPVEALAEPVPVRPQSRTRVWRNLAVVAAAVVVGVGVWIATRTKQPVVRPDSPAPTLEVVEGKARVRVSHGQKASSTKTDSHVDRDDRGAYLVNRQPFLTIESAAEGYVTVVVCSQDATRVNPTAKAPVEVMQLKRGAALTVPIQRGPGEATVFIFITDKPAASVVTEVFGEGPLTPADIDQRVLNVTVALQRAGHTRLERSRILVAPVRK